jgi:hypothetical protein
LKSENEQPAIRREVERTSREIVRVDAAESRESAAAMRWFSERQRSYARHLRGEARHLLGEIDAGVSAAASALGFAHPAIPAAAMASGGPPPIATEAPEIVTVAQTGRRPR